MVDMGDEAAIKKEIAAIRCFALDMDGTFYLGGELLEGSLEFIRRVRETGRRFVFLTNNSSKSHGAYMQKLAGMGLKISPDELVTSGGAAIAYLHANHPGKRVFLLGNPMLTNEFREAGINLNETDPELVVTAYDTSLDYRKLCKVCDYVRSGLPFLATHPDYNCPTETGFEPDIGAIHAFIEASTGRFPDRIIGKPYRDIMDFALSKCGCGPSETAMVGDRLYTDIALKKHVPGLCAILVLTGEASAGDIPGADIKPDMVFDKLGDIARYCVPQD
ncbi:MAG: HAD-IIA family hydrolase [Oscillospiraceae bacterium]|nr:HAD-IIA family hydrolase [Oscillospiraceae bacterium]